MIVILLKDVKGTGKAGDVVKVKDGYARNKLTPGGFAKEATDGNVRNLEKQKELMAKKHLEDIAAAEKLKEKLESAEIEIKSKAGDGDRLFGSITNIDIAEAVKAQLGVEIDRKKMQLDAPIKVLGTHAAEVKLYADVAAKLNLKVVRI